VITKGINGPGSVVFDPSGDLWVANTTGTIVEYSKGALAEASPTPTVIISYQGVVGIAFDPSGDLWTSSDSVVDEFRGGRARQVRLPKTGRFNPRPQTLRHGL
jgi:streptogramin lyase